MSSATAVAAEPAPETQPPIPKICANCKHWRQKHMTPHFGDCLESHKGGPAPIMMPDLGKCGGFSLR